MTVVAIPLIALLVVAPVYALAELRSRRATDLVAHTLEVRGQLERVEGIFLGESLDLRGYLLTGTLDYLQRSERAQAQVPAELSALDRLVSDDPVQAARVDGLREAAERLHLTLYALRRLATPAAAPTGRERELLQESSGYTDDVLARLALMGSEEERLLEIHRASERDAERLSRLVVAVTVPAGICLGLLAVLLFTSGVGRRLRDVEENARRLAAGQALEPLPASEDEIGRLSSALAESAALVREGQAAIAESEARYRSMARNFPNGAVILFDHDLRFTIVEGTILHELGYDRERFEGKTIWEALPPETVAQVEPLHRAALEGRIVSSEITHDGRDYLMQMCPVQGERGDVLGGMAVALDITERKRAEEDARSTGRFLDSIVENIPNMVFVKDAEDLRFVRFNRAGEELLGVPREGLIGRNDYDFFPREEADFFTAKDREVLEGRGVLDIPEEPIETKNGTRLLHTRKIPILGEGGEPRFLLGISDDITERKAAEAELRRWAHVFERAEWGVVVGSADGTTLEAMNPAFARMHGFEVDQLVGRPISTVFAPDAWPAAMEAIREAHERGHRTFESEHVRRDGTVFPVLLDMTAVRDERGELLYSVVNVQDITDRKRAEEAIRSAKEEAERANRAKDGFLSRMSHELRTPLNSILGFAQVIEMDDISPDHRESVEHILRAGRHLLSLIDEVLDISRVASGELSISQEPVSVTEVVRESVELIVPLAAERGVSVRAEDANGLHVLADRQRLKQVLLNLLSNAVKFNRDGGDVRLNWAKGDGGWLRIDVTDTGPGIAPHLLERVFSPFDRLGAEATGVEGTGLGLSLTKGLMEAMGGTIDVESEPGVGSTFRIHLQLAESPVDRYERHPDASLPAGGDGASAKRTLLYIEDNASNLTLIKRVLERVPEFELITAMQGRLGLDLARRHRPDLILLDLHLPDMSGEDVLRALREDAVTAGIPVVVVSADATPGQVERLLAAGANEYLTKPLDVGRFLDVVRVATRRSVTT